MHMHGKYVHVYIYREKVEVYKMQLYSLVIMYLNGVF